MAFQAFTSPDFNKNCDRTGWRDGNSPCVICGKGIPPANQKFGLHLTGRGEFLLADGSEKVDPAADMGWWPIGRDCRRKHPELKPYIIGPRPA